MHKLSGFNFVFCAGIWFYIMLLAKTTSFFLALCKSYIVGQSKCNLSSEVSVTDAFECSYRGQQQTSSYWNPSIPLDLDNFLPLHIYIALVMMLLKHLLITSVFTSMWFNDNRVISVISQNQHHTITPCSFCHIEGIT